MQKGDRRIAVMVADDDLDNGALIRGAFDENQPAADLRFVGRGEVLMGHRRRRTGLETGGACAPRPDPILIHLGTSEKDGREVLMELKLDPNPASIPIAAPAALREEEEMWSRNWSEAARLSPRCGRGFNARG